MFKKKSTSRRSFFVDLASSAAGVLLAAGGISAMSGCGDDGDPPPLGLLETR